MFSKCGFMVALDIDELFSFVSFIFLTITGEFQAAVFTLVTLLCGLTTAGGAMRAGVTLQREAWREETFT